MEIHIVFALVYTTHDICFESGSFFCTAIFQNFYTDKIVTAFQIHVAAICHATKVKTYVQEFRGVVDPDQCFVNRHICTLQNSRKLTKILCF